jgi:alkylation response protein AidB-like acyl-CoA dehydrogenase
MRTTPRLRQWLALAGWAALAWPVWAGSARLDDSASPQALVRADLGQARAIGERLIELPLGRVEYRLATAAYMGRQARIFYVIPPMISGLRSPGGMQVHWRGSGVFAGGAGRPGDRVLVWNGPVHTPWMSETLDLRLHLDPRELRMPPGSALSFESFFEIETLP